MITRTQHTWMINKQLKLHLRQQGASNFAVAASANTPDGLPKQIPPFMGSLPNGYVE